MKVTIPTGGPEGPGLSESEYTFLKALRQLTEGLRGQSLEVDVAALRSRYQFTNTIGVVATERGPIAAWLRGSSFVLRRYQNLEALLDDHQLSRPRFVVSAEGMAGCDLYSELLVAREQGQGIMVSKVRPSERATSPDHRFVGQELNANLRAQIDRGLEAPCPVDLLDRNVVRAMSLCVWPNAD